MNLKTTLWGTIVIDYPVIHVVLLHFIMLNVSLRKLYKFQSLPTFATKLEQARKKLWSTYVCKYYCGLRFLFFWVGVLSLML
jgi:hypothetical protein